MGLSTVAAARTTVRTAMAGPVSIKEAARRLGVTPKEIRRRIKRGELTGLVEITGAQGAVGGSTDAAAPPSGGWEPEIGAGIQPPRAVQSPRTVEQAPSADPRDAEIQRLQEMVAVLRAELDARRREVQELHVLLREQQRTMLTAARHQPAPLEEASAPAAETRPEAASVSPAVPDSNGEAASTPPERNEPEASAERREEIDWQAYDAESEQLRQTMGRLQELLEELERATPEESQVEPPTPAEPEVSAPSPAAVEAQPAGPSAPPTQARVEAAVPAEPIAEPTAEPEARVDTAPPPATHVPVAQDETPTGAELTRRREAMGLSREAVAAASGLSWGFVTEVERGRRKDIRSRQRLAEALAVLAASR